MFDIEKEITNLESKISADKKRLAHLKGLKKQKLENFDTYRQSLVGKYYCRTNPQNNDTWLFHIVKISKQDPFCVEAYVINNNQGNGVTLSYERSVQVIDNTGTYIGVSVLYPDKEIEKEEYEFEKKKMLCNIEKLFAKI